MPRYFVVPLPLHQLLFQVNISFVIEQLIELALTGTARAYPGSAEEYP